MVARTQLRSETLRPPVQKQARLTAPVGGLNFINNTMDFPLTDAYILDNGIPRPYGVELRKGYQNWMPRTWVAFSTVRNGRVSSVMAKTLPTGRG